MFLTIVETVVPAVVVFTTLFGVLARGDPKPGGVALFIRVGVAGMVLGGLLAALATKTAAFARWPALAVNACQGLIFGGVLLFLFGLVGAMLKKK